MTIGIFVWPKWGGMASASRASSASVHPPAVGGWIVVRSGSARTGTRSGAPGWARPAPPQVETAHVARATPTATTAARAAWKRDISAPLHDRADAPAPDSGPA